MATSTNALGPGLSDRYRCITPDGPLGGHQIPFVTEDQPEHLTSLIVDFLSGRQTSQAGEPPT